MHCRVFAVVLLLLVLGCACGSGEMHRTTAQAFEKRYIPPYITYQPIMIGKMMTLLPVHHDAEYIVYFDVGEKYGVPAHMTSSGYEAIVIGAFYDITYSDHVIQFH